MKAHPERLFPKAKDSKEEMKEEEDTRKRRSSEKHIFEQCAGT